MFDEIFKDFDDVMFGDFCNPFSGTVSYLKFNSNRTQDQHPIVFQKLAKDDKMIDKNHTVYRATVRSVGVAPKDISVKLDNKTLWVKGETGNKDSEYDFEIGYDISDDLIGQIDNIKFKSENGITYIYLFVKRNVPDIKIERM